EPYTGPRFDQIGTLAPDERDALDSALARLIDTRRPVAPVPASGSLRLNAEVMSAALPPTLERTIPTPLPESASAQAQMIARIWNRYGGLLDTVGRILQVDPTLAAGVLAIESGGRAFSASGRMIIRFELHIFFNLWGKANVEQFDRHFRLNPDAPWRGDGHLWRPDEQTEWKAVHAGQDGEWDAFGFARVYCSDDHAKLSISMGAPQIMGFNHARIGYADVDSMYDAFENDERSQIVGFFDFVRTDSRLLEAMRREDLFTFATYYNGTAVAETYARLMRDATNALRALLPTAPVKPEPEPDPVCRPNPVAPPTTGPWGAPKPGVQPTTPQPPTSGPSTRPQPDHLPLPIAPMPITGSGSETDLRSVDPVLYAYWQEHVREGFARNSEMFRRVLDGFMEPYHTTIWMYRILFSVGLLAFVAAIGFSLWFGQPMYALIFGGLSAAAFISYFFNRPLQALEENLHFITWLGIIYNTYWTRLAYMFDQKTVQQDLHAATTDAVQELDRLLDKHAELSGKRPNATVRD
ncbi:MAG: N-acetylmuramidase domain-containing protein, partial [Caldilineaceae bacterium]